MMEEIPNPFREAAPLAREAPPATLVIFGASGDLTSRKLIPALCKLSRERMLAPGTAIVGVARRVMTDDAFREVVRAYLANAFPAGDSADAAQREEFTKGVFYSAGSFEDEATYGRLAAKLEEIDRARGTAGNRLFYLATPPSAFPVIVRHLDAARLVNRAKDGPWTRIII